MWLGSIITIKMTITDDNNNNNNDTMDNESKSLNCIALNSINSI